MNTAEMEKLASMFLGQYDARAKDVIWQEHRTAFRSFWSEQVLAQETGVIPDDTCDVIIRILDRHGKGNTRDREAVARIMVPQGAMRTLLNSLHFNRDLALLIDSILKAEDPEHMAERIDDLMQALQGAHAS